MKRSFYRLLSVGALLLPAACETKPKVTLPQKDYSNVPPLFRTHSLEVDPRLEKYPVAEAIPEKPGFVRSPYTGQVVNTKAVKPGGLAKDPSITDEPHYFRTPP